jgi:Regulator of MON1-CCZ1 complex, C-terminal
VYKYHERLNDWRLLKEYKVSRLAWFVYSHGNRFLVCASGAKSNTMNAFYFEEPDAVLKLPKFTIDVSGQPPRYAKISADQIVIANVYRRPFCAYIDPHRQRVTLFQYNRGQVLLLGHYLTHTQGPVALHVVDNLLVVHNLESKIPMLFDLRTKEKDFPVVAPLPLGEPPSIAGYGSDASAAASSSSSSSSSTMTRERVKADLPAIELYNDSWLFFQPRYVLDMRAGLMWELQLNLDAIAQSFSDKKRLIQFLLRRERSKPLILQALRTMIEERENLSLLSTVFDVINAALSAAPQSTRRSRKELRLNDFRHFRKVIAPSLSQQQQQQRDAAAYNGNVNSPLSSASSSFESSGDESSSSGAESAASGPASDHIDRGGDGDDDDVETATTSNGDDNNDDGDNDSNGARRQRRMASRESLRMVPRSKMSGRRNPDGLLIVEQSDVYTHVFLPIGDELSLDHKYVVAVITEYIRSLNWHRVNPQHFLYELIIDNLVRHNRFCQLHQYLQFHVIADSVPVACQLLSLESTYSPAYQLAMDMFKRLCSPEQIVEVLLMRSQLLPALRVVQAHNVSPQRIPRHRFLKAAAALDDSTLFFTVYRFFEQRKELPSNDANLAIYHSHFHSLFN